MEIPRGLDYLAERLVRAVIRVQPKNVHEFAAQFFDGLLRQRDQCKYLYIIMLCCYQALCDVIEKCILRQ